MTDRPKSPFNLSANPKQQDIADRGNTNRRHEPKQDRPRAPGLAPGGMIGVKRGLPSPEQSQSARPRFELGKSGEMKKTFNSVVSKDQDRTRDR
ncbi:MAG: hypothetical protein HWE33_15145 [Rhodobacteraceae bacterium]|nr:hypothetical protein [Paracoccaceae bacterium]